MIFENIDELFNKPHISAVVAGKKYKGNEKWEEFNSGLMVIEPKKDALRGIEKPWMLSKKTILRKLCSLLIQHKNIELRIYMKHFRLYSS